MRSAPGKQAEGQQWAVEIAKFVNTLNMGEVHAHAARFGDMTQIGWSSTAESLAQLEEQQAALLTNETYMKMLVDVQARGLFTGSIQDQVWNQLL
ncbi:MAG: hypothetical protein O3A76_12000 [Chloroflexi bacterium]|nr:hypothetical protein [Chloroflexota bacterium]